MLNPTGGDRESFFAWIFLIRMLMVGAVGGKCGYVWGATGLICFVVAFFGLPEMKGRSYREIDILFKRGVPARKWTKTEIDVNDDE